LLKNGNLTMDLFFHKSMTFYEVFQKNSVSLQTKE